MDKTEIRSKVTTTVGTGESRMHRNPSRKYFLGMKAQDSLNYMKEDSLMENSNSLYMNMTSLRS